MATKYKTAFKKLTATWKRRGTVKGKRHVKWGGKRGAFSAIQKAASKEVAKKPTKKRKAPKRKAPKRKAKKASRRAPKRSVPRAKRRKPAKRKKTTARRKPAKRKARATRKRASSTGKRAHIVSGKTRMITPYRAKELRRAGKKVRLAKSNPGRHRASTRGRAGIGLLGKIAIGAGLALGGYTLYRVVKGRTA